MKCVGVTICMKILRSLLGLIAFLFSALICNATQQEPREIREICMVKSESADNLLTPDLSVTKLYDYFQTEVCKRKTDKYTVSANSFANDIPQVLKQLIDRQKSNSLSKLKDNLLYFGHLGYYPIISVPKDRLGDAIVNAMIPRGIFHINPVIANRVFSKKLNYLSPAENLGYAVDSKDAPNDLSAAADELINTVLFSKDANNASIKQTNSNTRLEIEFDYIGKSTTNIIANPLGMNSEGKTSNRIRLIVQIVGEGIIEVVDAYPV